MGENSKIEWCHHTFNPWIGCQHVSPGCDNCYAETLMDKRYGKVQWGPHGARVRTGDANWKLPLRWAKAARGLDYRPRVFCASLADVFDNHVVDAWRSDLFALIEDTPELDWLLLTKRPQNIANMIWPKWDSGLPHNIWLGTTIEDRERGVSRAWKLAQIPAVVRFWSVEPLLEDLGDLTGMCLFDTAMDGRPAVSWVICGGESGRGARMMQPAWAASIKQQCATARVPFFMKQMTAKTPIPADLLIQQIPLPAHG